MIQNVPDRDTSPHLSTKQKTPPNSAAHLRGHGTLSAVNPARADTCRA